MSIHGMAQDFFAVSSRWRFAPEHQSQHRRKTVFDETRRGLVGGLVNEFPVHHQCPAVALCAFRLAGHQILTKKHETRMAIPNSAVCARGNPVNPDNPVKENTAFAMCAFCVSEFSVNSWGFRVQQGIDTKWRAKARHCAGGLPTGARTGLAARRLSRSCRCWLSCSGAERPTRIRSQDSEIFIS